MPVAKLAFTGIYLGNPSIFVAASVIKTLTFPSPSEAWSETSIVPLAIQAPTIIP